jgi:hypothetical protein
MLRGRTKLTTLNIKVIHEIQRSKRAYRLIFRVKIAGLTTSRQTPAQNQLHRTLSSLSDETWLNSGDILLNYVMTAKILECILLGSDQANSL